MACDKPHVRLLLISYKKIEEGPMQSLFNLKYNISHRCLVLYENYMTVLYIPSFSLCIQQLKSSHVTSNFYESKITAHLLMSGFDSNSCLHTLPDAHAANRWHQGTTARLPVLLMLAARNSLSERVPFPPAALS